MIFPKEGVTFLKNLAANNTRDWFQAQKSTYEQTVREPTKEFAAAIAHGLEGMLGVPLEYKVFRINRDLRFSKDKTPYNTHIRIAFWQNSTAKPMTTPSFYLSIEADHWVLGAGCLQMPAKMLSSFRATLKKETKAAKFNDLLQNLLGAGKTLSDPELKRLLHGIDPTHPEESHMRRKGLVCWHREEQETPTDITAKKILTTATAMAPLYHWLKALE